MSLERVENWMEQAYVLALEAARYNEVPVGALLIADNKIIGSGSNDRESANRTIGHAEILALEDYNRRTSLWRVFPGTSLVVTVEPCLMCTGALLWARVDNIYYGCVDPKDAGLRRLLPLIGEGAYDHRFKYVQGGIQQEKCSQLLSSYFSGMRHEKRQPELT